MIELELIINQKDNELSVKDAVLAVKNKELEEKNRTIKQLTEKLQLLQSQYHDYIMELCDKLRVKDDKIEELSTKLAEVVVGNKKHDDEVAYWKDVIDRKNEYMDELHEQLEDLQSIIEGQKENIADLENEVEKLKDRLSSTSDKAGPYKMPDYEGFRKKADEAQRKMMEEQKNWDNESNFQTTTKRLWEILFNE